MPTIPHDLGLDYKGDGSSIQQESHEKESNANGDNLKDIKLLDDLITDGGEQISHCDVNSYSKTDDVLNNECDRQLESGETGRSNENASKPTKSCIPQGSGNTAGNEDDTPSDADGPKPVTFTDPRQRHVFSILTSIQNLRESRQFSDVIVKVEEQQFRCHRFVISSTSSLFRSLLESCVSEAGSPCNGNFQEKPYWAPLEQKPVISAKTERDDDGSFVDVILIKGIKPDIFNKVMDYMYCVFDGIFNDCNCLDLLLAAEVLKLPELCQMCTEHIVQMLTVDNVFDVMKVCDAGCATLLAVNTMKSCLQVIRKHFPTMPSQPKFLSLGRQHMIALVADSMLNVETEVDTIHAILRWVEHKQAERSADLTLMLQHVRFPLMTFQELDQLKDKCMLTENPLAMALVEESRSYSLLDYPDRMAWPRQNCISRINFSSRDFLIWTAHRDKGLHLLSIADGLHYQVSSFSEDTVNSVGFSFDSTATVCCNDSKLMFTGGEFNTDLAWSLDSSTGEVAVLGKMPRGRKFHSAVAMRGWVYCLGGQDKRGYSVLNTVDAYLISKGVWLKVGHLAVAAYNMAAVCSKGAIYMVGGVDHSGQQLRTIQCFVALRSGLYSAFKMNISNMPPSLLSARVVVSGFQACVYVVCGHGEVYRLDAEENLVHYLATLKPLSQNPRVQFGAAHIGGHLIITGGHQLSQVNQRAIRSICWDISGQKEVKDFIPLLPADIVNSCLAVKLSANVMSLFQT